MEKVIWYLDTGGYGKGDGIMLQKNAKLVIGKDDEGLVLVDEVSHNGIQVKNESMLHLMLVVWERCDRLDAPGIAEELLKEAAETEPDQRKTFVDVIKRILDSFVEAQWATRGIEIARS
jgi:hypothetical protein